MFKFISEGIAKNKKECQEWEDRLLANYHLPDGIELTQDITYHEGRQEYRLDLYRPTDTDEKLPVIINIHGGALLMGSKRFNRPFCAELAKQGFIVAAVEYPLVPDVHVYEQFQAVQYAMEYVRLNLEQYGADFDHVYLTGDSGGAYLALYSAALQRSSAMAQAAGVTCSTLKIKALGLLCGMIYSKKIDSHCFFLMDSAFYGSKWRKHPFYPYTSPEHPEIVRKLPPCFLITARGDYLRSYTLNFAKILRKNGIDYELADRAEKLEHIFSVVDPFSKEGAAVNQQMTDFLKKW